MRTALTFVSLLFLPLVLSAQKAILPEYMKNRPIEIKQSFFGTTYHVGDMKLSGREVRFIMSNNANCEKSFLGGQEAYVVGSLLGVTGGAMMGYTISELIIGSQRHTGDSPNWLVFGIGAGLGSLGILLEIIGGNTKIKAVERYNAGLEPLPTAHGRPRLRAAQNGLGIAVVF